MYTYNDNAAAYGLGAAFAGMFGFMIIIGLAVAVFTIFVMWKAFEKAGKPGWAAIVPIYNTIILLEIVGYKWYYIFVFLISIVPVIGSLALLAFLIHLGIKTAKAYGQEIPFGIGIALLPVVFFAIIAFNKDIKYVGPTVKGDIDFNDLF